MAMLCLWITVVQALDITAFTPAIDKKVASKSTLKEKISYLQGIQAVLALPAFKTHPEARLFANLNEYIKNFVNALEHENGATPSIPSTPASSSSKVARNHTDVLGSDGKSYLVVDNVDLQKVRNTLLSRHNEERQIKKLPAYTYHSNLEKSAQIWARVLNDEARTSNTHVRKPGDGYYNYNSIMDRMEGMGNSFSTPGNGNPAFTESVGRGYYTCKSWDCTEALIAALKTTRDFFMSEKKSNGAHYRAITASQFTQMGFGVSIDPAKKRYYVVLHYSVDLVKTAF